MSLDNATILFVSDKIKDYFSGNEIAGCAGEYCVINGLKANFKIQGRYESKAKFTSRIFSSLPAEYQAGLVHHFVSKSQKLQEDSSIQQLLLGLSQEYNLLPQTIEEVQLTEIENLLVAYPKSLSLWQKALLHNQSFQYRESLDNARLCLEKLLNEILCNSKSLENQRAELGKWFKNKRIPTEVHNMVWSTIEKYTKFQNNNIKHNLSDGLTKDEFSFVLDETHAIIKYLTKQAKEMTDE
ncbi:hypothetical protein [Streptococcus thoraltensis]|uniref:hypothetical protein n=1 Tax=Streptococcus thoraltensis TaxID=55085 RepID=UPI001F584591|nr:hypothetical protein [Streptococcus thoraltensis]